MDGETSGRDEYIFNGHNLLALTTLDRPQLVEIRRLNDSFAFWAVCLQHIYCPVSIVPSFLGTFAAKKNAGQQAANSSGSYLSQDCPASLLFIAIPHGTNQITRAQSTAAEKTGKGFFLFYAWIAWVKESWVIFGITALATVKCLKNNWGNNRAVLFKKPKNLSVLVSCLSI